MIGLLVAAIGLTAIVVGVFGRDFRWGISGAGEPAPEGRAREFFIILGVIFAIVGVVAVFKGGCSQCPTPRGAFS
jgi:hypothetical protein